MKLRNTAVRQPGGKLPAILPEFVQFRLAYRPSASELSDSSLEGLDGGTAGAGKIMPADFTINKNIDKATP